MQWERKNDGEEEWSGACEERKEDGVGELVRGEDGESAKFLYKRGHPRRRTYWECAQTFPKATNPIRVFEFGGRPRPCRVL